MKGSKRMKKSKTMLLAALAVVLSLSGCAGEKTTEKSKARILPVRIDSSYFPDASLRKYLYYVCDQNSDGVLDEKEISETTTLNLVGTGVESLKGIEWLPELTYINCSNSLISEENRYFINNGVKNDVKELDVSKNKNLVVLYCGGSGLTSLDVSNNPNLIVLSCGGNELQELDISKNKNLEVLVCNGNPLHSLDVKGNTKLATLDVNEDTEVIGAGGSVRITRHDPNERAAIDEASNIKHDDDIISDINRASLATLADERFYSTADSTVTVTVAPDGTITVNGLVERDAFIIEVSTAVFGSTDPTNYFRSQAYTEGGSTRLVYKFNTTLYTWENTIMNNIEQSKYYEGN